MNLEALVSQRVRDTRDTPVSRCLGVSPLKGGRHPRHSDRPPRMEGVPGLEIPRALGQGAGALCPRPTGLLADCPGSEADSSARYSRLADAGATAIRSPWYAGCPLIGTGGRAAVSVFAVAVVALLIRVDNAISTVRDLVIYLQAVHDLNPRTRTTSNRIVGQQLKQQEYTVLPSACDKAVVDVEPVELNVERAWGGHRELNSRSRRRATRWECHRGRDVKVHVPTCLHVPHNSEWTCASDNYRRRDIGSLHHRSDTEISDVVAWPNLGDTGAREGVQRDCFGREAGCIWGAGNSEEDRRTASLGTEEGLIQEDLTRCHRKIDEFGRTNRGISLGRLEDHRQRREVDVLNRLGVCGGRSDRDREKGDKATRAASDTRIPHISSPSESMRSVVCIGQGSCDRDHTAIMRSPRVLPGSRPTRVR